MSTGRRGTGQGRATTLKFNGYGAASRLWFQSPPPKRGACDPSCVPATSRRCGFNPLRRSGGRATKAAWGLYPKPWEGVSIPSAEAGGVRRFLPWSGSRSSRSEVSIPSAEAGGVRPGAALNRAGVMARVVSIPSAEAGGVRLDAPVQGQHRRGRDRFNPLRRSGGRATVPGESLGG